MLSRILSLADAFDVMTRGTPYRPPLTREEAFLEVEKQSGSQFDPGITALFLANRKKLDEEPDDQLSPEREFNVE